MRIISQNRDLSIDFDRTPISVNYNHVLALVEDKERVIGQYETPERAREVFDAINDFYKPIDDIRSLDAIGLMQSMSATKRELQVLNRNIYEMPKE